MGKQIISAFKTFLSLSAGPAILFCIALGSAVAAAPYLPSEDSRVLEQLPTPGDAEQRALRRLRTALSEDPRDLKLALDLARRSVALGRAEADPRYYGYAEAALQPWWQTATPPSEVLVLRAVLTQARHDFDGALADLDRVLALKPRHGQAWLTRAFVLQVQGRHAAARESCLRLLVSAAPLVRATCLARVDSLSGAAAAGYARLEAAIQGSPDTERSLRLWALTNLAEIAERAGRRKLAERHFREALDLGLRNAYLLGAYADFLLDEGRPEEARQLLEGEDRVDALLLRRALAEAALGSHRAARHVATLETRFAASRRRGDVRHRREEARFTLHFKKRPAAALELALENWQVQREPWDARLVLEAALAAEAPSRAKAVLAWLAETGLEDPRIQALARKLEEAGA